MLIKSSFSFFIILIANLFIQYSIITSITSFFIYMPIELVVSEIIENAFNIDFNTIFAVTFRTAIVTLLIVFVIKWLGNKV